MSYDTTFHEYQVYHNIRFSYEDTALLEWVATCTVEDLIIKSNI